MFTFVAVLLYVAPVALFVAMRSERERPLWAVALDVPLAVAADVLGQLALALMLRFQLAVLVSRLAWLAIAIAVIVWRRRRTGWPLVLDVRTIGAVAGTVAPALALSMWVSQACHVFDRAWHIPLVGSLLGQTIPFHNVYQPEGRLEYHYTGDLAAGAIQALSFGHMHASLALSVAHDVFFGLMAATAALLLRGLGVRSIVWTVVGGLAPLLGGPIDSPYSGGHPSYRGYNFVNFYQLSFRPHVPLAGLLMLGFVGAAAVALSRMERPTGWRTWSVIVVCTAALTLTDEASTGILGMVLGATWIVAPRVVHPKRLVGIGVFGALLGALLLPHVIFGGTLAPGSLPQYPVWVWRVPGFLNDPVSLASVRAWKILLVDTLPALLYVLAALVLLFDARRREHVAVAVALAVLFVITVGLLCAIEVRANIPVPRAGWSGQNHRFVTALLVTAPLFLAATLVHPSAERPRRWLRVAVLGVGAVSLVLSSVSMLAWAGVGSREFCTQPSLYRALDDFFALDCKRATGSRAFGSETRPAYGAGSILYTYAGCNPLYLPGPRRLDYRLKIGLALIGVEGLKDVSRFVAPSDPLPVLCPRRAGYPSDEVCAYVMRRGKCTPMGDEIVVCEMSGGDRRALAPARGIVPRGRGRGIPGPR